LEGWKEGVEGAKGGRRGEREGKIKSIYLGDK